MGIDILFYTIEIIFVSGIAALISHIYGESAYSCSREEFEPVGLSSFYVDDLIDRYPDRARYISQQKELFNLRRAKSYSLRKMVDKGDNDGLFLFILYIPLFAAVFLEWKHGFVASLVTLAAYILWGILIRRIVKSRIGEFDNKDIEISKPKYYDKFPDITIFINYCEEEKKRTEYYIEHREARIEKCSDRRKDGIIFSVIFLAVCVGCRFTL